MSLAGSKYLVYLEAEAFWDAPTVLREKYDIAKIKHLALKMWHPFPNLDDAVTFKLWSPVHARIIDNTSGSFDPLLIASEEASDKYRALLLRHMEGEDVSAERDIAFSNMHSAREALEAKLPSS